MLSDQVTNIIEAATALAERGLEMDGRVAQSMRTALSALAEAVDRFGDAEELRRELEAEGVFEPGVVHSGMAPVGVWSRAVSDVVSAAEIVHDQVFTQAVLTIPAESVPAVDGLVLAVQERRAFADDVATARRTASRLTVLSGADRAIEEAGGAGAPAVPPPRQRQQHGSVGVGVEPATEPAEDLAAPMVHVLQPAPWGFTTGPQPQRSWRP